MKWFRGQGYSEDPVYKHQGAYGSLVTTIMLMGSPFWTHLHIPYSTMRPHGCRVACKLQPLSSFLSNGSWRQLGYFNQVWVRCGQSSLMGAERCMDYVKGSLLTDETASLPWWVQANHTLTHSGRRSTYALLCFPLLPVRKKCFGIVLI